VALGGGGMGSERLSQKISTCWSRVDTCTPQKKGNKCLGKKVVPPAQTGVEGKDTKDPEEGQGGVFPLRPWVLS